MISMRIVKKEFKYYLLGLENKILSIDTCSELGLLRKIRCNRCKSFSPDNSVMFSSLRGKVGIIVDVKISGWRELVEVNNNFKWKRSKSASTLF